ncbi:MAG: NAD(P)-dependent oxidoreductase, partial [Planctomycetota bacterium]
NSIAVAELVWALILSCDRRVPDQTVDLRNHRWNKKKYTKAKGLFGRTLGVIGTGKIGMAVAERGKAFGMEVVAWSRSLTEEKARQMGLEFYSSLDELARQADVVSVNVAASAETEKLIDAHFLESMKTGAFLINTSRGSVVDQDALMDAIVEKGIRAGLDVYADEPGGGEDEFVTKIASLEGVYGTHHIGASTDQAQTAIASEAVRIVKSFIDSGEVPNCVNLATKTPANYLLTVRHKNVAGVLANVFQIIDEANINVEEMQNVIYDGANAACAKIQLGEELGSVGLDAIRSNPNVLSIEINTIHN